MSQLIGSQTVSGHGFGSGVSLKDDVLAISAPGGSTCELYYIILGQHIHFCSVLFVGAVYIYQGSSGGVVWTELLWLTPIDGSQSSGFGKGGQSIAFNSEGTVIVGSKLTGDEGSNTGTEILIVSDNFKSGSKFIFSPLF